MLVDSDMRYGVGVDCLFVGKAFGDASVKNERNIIHAFVFTGIC